MYEAYEETMRQNVDHLWLIPMFIFVFYLFINRLITLLFLYCLHDYVGKYISLEKLIERTKETYYESLQESSFLWHENNYILFTDYYLGMIVAYREFLERIQLLVTSGMSKPERWIIKISGRRYKAYIWNMEVK